MGVAKYVVDGECIKTGYSPGNKFGKAFIEGWRAAEKYADNQPFPPPRDRELELARLQTLQAMTEAGWSADDVRRILPT